MAGAVISKGTKVSIKTTGTTFVKINGFLNFSGIGGGSPATIDATDLDSTAKEKLPGLPDEGSVKLEFNFIPTDAGQQALLTARGDQSIKDFQLQVGLTKMVAFSGYVKTWEPATGVDKIVTLSCEVEITGSNVWSTVTP